MKHTTALLLFAFAIARVHVAAADDIDAAAVRRASHPPLGLPPVVVPADNPLTVAKVALGRKIFFDRRLSVNGTLSCAMCHVPEQGYTQDELKTPVGMEGHSIRRNAPSIVNAVYEKALFRDGRAPTLEVQALKPLIDPDEMSNPNHEAVVEKIRELADYDGLFERAFGRPSDVEGIAKAIASWERTMVSADAPFDRWHFGGDQMAISAAAKRGFAIFSGSAGCAACHTLEKGHALFTDHDYHNTGIGAARNRPAAAAVRVEIEPNVYTTLPMAVVDTVSGPTRPDLGRMEVTGSETDRFAFKTPSLRNVALTGPYMHDGSLDTLESVVRYYNRGGNPNPGLDPRVRPLGLGEGDVADLVAFLRSLTGSNFGMLVAADAEKREQMR